MCIIVHKNTEGDIGAFILEHVSEINGGHLQ